MRARSLALLVLALGCGLVASIGITQVMARRNTERVAPVGETEPILVAAVAIPPNEPLSAAMLRLEHWPKGKVPPGSLTQIEEVEKRRSRTRIYPGEAILKNKLLGKGAAEPGASPQIPMGMRVVSVKVDAVSGAASLILPGDRVDVLVHLLANPSAGINEPSTQTILQNIKVFAVDAVVDLERMDTDNKALPAKTISLLVSPEQAQKVTLATELGQVRLVMRGPEDDQDAEVRGLSPRELFGKPEKGQMVRDNVPPTDDKPAATPDFLALLKSTMGGGQAATPEPPKPGAEEPAKPSMPNTFMMRIIVGNKTQVVSMEPEAGQADADGKPSLWRQTVQETGEASPAPAAAPPTVAPDPDTEDEKPAPGPTEGGKSQKDAPRHSQQDR